MASENIRRIVCGLCSRLIWSGPDWCDSPPMPILRIDFDVDKTETRRAWAKICTECAAGLFKKIILGTTAVSLTEKTHNTDECDCEQCREARGLEERRRSETA